MVLIATYYIITLDQFIYALPQISEPRTLYLDMIGNDPS
jgi:hypothetical protein